MTYDDVQERFAQRIEAFRGQVGLTKRQFSRHIGVNINAYDYYINKGGMPTLYTAVLIAERLGITLDQLMGIRGGKK